MMNSKQILERLIEEIISLDDYLEILVVDDDSPDGTGEIIDKLCSKHNEKIKLLISDTAPLYPPL